MSIIKIKAKNLKTYKEKTFGLAFRKTPLTVYFDTILGIHTFGVKFPIDVLILDNNFNVKKVKKNLSPCRFFFWNIKYSKVIEAPSGTVSKNSIKIGDKIEIEYI